MERQYKYHSILITTWPSLSPAGFIPQIRISNGSSHGYKRLRVSDLFTTKEEAHLQAYELAKVWIDSRITTKGTG